MSDQTAFPLCWPPGRPRTKFRTAARFDTSFAGARDGLATELERLGARQPILSTNIELRIDGQPYANRANPADPGAAVYFHYKGKSYAFACDRWSHVADNIQAIRKTIEALRGIARWGTGDMMEAAFTGFAQLPAKTGPDCWDILGIARIGATEASILDAYRTKAKSAHPDTGGSNEAFAAVVQAKDNALAILKGGAA